MSKPWKTINSQVNNPSTTNTTDLITPNADPTASGILQTDNRPPQVPVVKRDTNPSLINDNYLNSTNANLNINSNNPSSDPTTNSSNALGTQNTNTNTGTSLYGGGYGGYGMGGYGGYGGYGMSSYGGYGSGYGMSGYGGHGMGGYGGMSGMYGNRMGQGGQESILDQCFFIVERLNYQMFHFCEMTRMIQAQSASLTYFLEIMKKAYDWVKTFITNHTKSFINNTKLLLIQKLVKLKQNLKEFFTTKEVEDDKLKKHIKALDYMITILLVGAVAGLFLKVY